jgi:hypothetical protein
MMRPFTRRTLTAATGTLVAALALAACTGVSSAYRDYPIFEREATAADQPPQQILDDIAEDATDDLTPDAESARLAGTYEGVSLWLTKTLAAGNICLIAVPEADVEAVSMCGSAAGGEMSGAGIGVYGYQPQGAELQSNATAISENVYVLRGDWRDE